MYRYGSFLNIVYKKLCSLYNTMRPYKFSSNYELSKFLHMKFVI